jgi:hypothetical protein
VSETEHPRRLERAAHGDWEAVEQMEGSGGKRLRQQTPMRTRLYAMATRQQLVRARVERQLPRIGANVLRKRTR